MSEIKAKIYICGLLNDLPDKSTANIFRSIIFDNEVNWKGIAETIAKERPETTKQ